MITLSRRSRTLIISWCQWRPHLAELHTALVQNPLDEQLEEAVPAGPEARLAQLPVSRDELGHHGTGLLEAVDARRARVPVLELGVVTEARQRQEEAQLAVVVFRRAEMLQAVEAPDRLLHGELQLQGERRVCFGCPLECWEFSETPCKASSIYSPVTLI